MSAEQESIAHMKFEATGDEAMQGRGTLDEWLDKARGEFATAGCMLVVLNNDQDQLFEKISESADDECDKWFSFVDMFTKQKKKHKAAAEMYEGAAARLLIVLERLVEGSGS